MKYLTLTLLVVTFATVGFSQKRLETVNAVIGDESFIQLFNIIPDENTDEEFRIQTHLAYVEQMLRDKETSHLSHSQQLKRTQVLDLLHEYWTAGVFPNNYDYPGERKPCFIDRDGNICAVGYLVEMTAGREVAEQINERHQYDYIADMHEESVNNWANEYGLSMEECAMIQPSYGGLYPTPDQKVEQPIKPGYGVSSGVLTGVNIAITITNLASRNPGSRTMNYVGLVTGAAQVILGATNIRKDVEYEPMSSFYPSGKSYKAQNNLSYLNIASGSATMITSAVNLFVNQKLNTKRNAFNLYSYPGMNQEMNMGVSFVRNL